MVSVSSTKVTFFPAINAAYWDDCLRTGFCLGWDNVGDLTQFEK